MRDSGGLSRTSSSCDGHLRGGGHVRAGGVVVLTLAHGAAAILLEVLLLYGVVPIGVGSDLGQVVQRHN